MPIANTGNLPVPPRPRPRYITLAQPEQVVDTTHETSQRTTQETPQRRHGTMPLWSLKKRKEAPPHLLHPAAIHPQFSQMPPAVPGQPSSMPTGGFVGGTSPAGYPPVYYSHAVSQAQVAGYPPPNMGQPASAPIQQPVQGIGVSGGNSPARMQEIKAMHDRLNAMLAEEKVTPSPEGDALNDAGREVRRRLRRAEAKAKQPTQSASEGPASPAGHSPRIHVCSDCDSIRSGAFQKLHGSSERRNFCSDCQIKRLEEHKLDPSLPTEHFCFQCGQARTKDFVKANPEAKRRMIANLCEECLLYSKSRQHVPESSTIGNNRDDQDVSVPSSLPSYYKDMRTNKGNSQLWPPRPALNLASELAMKL